MSKHKGGRGDETIPSGRFFPDMQVRTGEVAGSTTPKQLPDIPCQAVKIKAVSSNATSVNIGLAGVQTVQAVDREDVGWELAAGEETPWLFIVNLDRLYLRGIASGDDILYIIMR